jgi:hypothetical protein
MFDRENLEPGVREVVDMLGDPKQTVSLKDLLPGDQLFIRVGDRPQDTLDFVITSPAKEKCDSVNDSARALLPGWKYSSKLGEENVEVLIGGSCTYNPSSPSGMTMLSMGNLTVGRNMAIWLGETDEVVIFKTPIQEMTVIKK